MALMKIAVAAVVESVMSMSPLTPHLQRDCRPQMAMMRMASPAYDIPTF